MVLRITEIQGNEEAIIVPDWNRAEDMTDVSVSSRQYLHRLDVEILFQSKQIINVSELQKQKG